jgi:hypothetical protein
MNRKYTAEHIEYISINIKGRSYRELTDMFNERFGMDINVSAMVSLACKHGLHNGRDTHFNTGYEPTQFKKGHVPFNKGKKGIGGWEPTQFKKGCRPHNYKPVGTERTNTDGYVEIKIADPGKWKGKHIILWEEVNGAVPTGHVVIFADGNKQNVILDNLLLISRRELAVMNKQRLITNNAELTKTGVTIADIYLKIGERKKRVEL